MKDGFLLRAFREDKGLSRDQLAKKAGVPVRTLEKYEQGIVKIENASYKTVVLICRALDIQTTDLIPDSLIEN